MKWQKVFKVYKVSEDGLLKTPKGRDGWNAFDNYYQSEDEAVKDIARKSEGDLIYGFPDDLVIITCLVKVLE